MASKLKLRISNFITHPLLGRLIAKAFANRIPSFQGRLHIDPRFVPYEAVVAIFLRLYERSEVKLVTQFIRKDIDVIELGSGIGIVSLPIVQTQMFPNQLLCVEANPYVVPLLKQSLHANAPQKLVNVVSAAISYNPAKKVSLSLADMHLGSHLVDQPNQQSIQVGSVTLQQLLADFDIQSYALVADIEGAEIGIFLRDKAALTGCQQMIIELHNTSFEKQSFTVEDLSLFIVDELGFSIQARRHNVFVFNRS